VIPTLLDFTSIWTFAALRGLRIGLWLLEDGAVGPLEACQSRLRSAIEALAADPRAQGRGRLQPVRTPPGAGAEDAVQILDAQSLRPDLGRLEGMSASAAAYGGRPASRVPV
jgi:hypothetical protein